MVTLRPSLSDMTTLRRPDRLAAPVVSTAEQVAPTTLVSVVTLVTPAGQTVSRANARITREDGRWSALVTALDRPGVFATLYFVAGLRDVVLRLDNGTEATARITSTSFEASERICRLAGVDPLG